MKTFFPLRDTGLNPRYRPEHGLQKASFDAVRLSGSMYLRRSIGLLFLLPWLLLAQDDSTRDVKPAEITSSQAVVGNVLLSQGPPQSTTPIALPRTELTQVRQVRELSATNAARLIPVRLKGVVTALSGWKNSFFVQDSSSGISVDRTDSADVHAGDRVEITGTSGPGLFAPIVLASHVLVLGKSVPPVARQTKYGDLFGGAQDSQWIEMEGIVHSARITVIDGHTVLVLSLQVGAGSVSVKIADFTGIDYAHLVDATARIRGVCATDFNQKRQFVGAEMYTPSREFLEILEPANADPFSEQATPVRNALQFGQARRRIKVSGVSTYQIPGHTLYLQDGEDGIRIQSLSTQFVGPGRRVEAVGFPAIGEYAPILEDGFYRDLGPAAPVMPLRIDAKAVVAHREGFDQVPYDQQLVSLQGKVTESHIQGGQLIWMLQQGTEPFEASLPLSSVADGLKDIGIGSVLMLTGICTIHADSDHVPISFGILLRSPADVQVLQRASWWTQSHSLMMLAAAVGIISVVALWVAVLRKRVEHQTQMIRASEVRFRDLAHHDVLTGLPNRLMLEERIVETLKMCEHEKLRAVVLTIDIDRFKLINDNYGHPVGDACLRIVADRLRSLVRHADTIARTGGEEFTIVVGGLANCDVARRISSSILDLFHAPVVMEGNEIKLTVSIGGAFYPDDGIDSETLRKRSDQALHEAKRTGRNRDVFATEQLCVSAEQATSIELALREALRSNKFQLHYQPIYDSSQTIRRFEALLRTSEHSLAKLGPARFIPVAESTGLIFPLGRWVIEEACRQIAEWQSQGSFVCPIAVNISAHQITRKGFAEEVLALLERFHVEPRLLELELTETAAMTELHSVADTVSRLAAAGITFSIDDFGTGYSSLSRLHELPIKALKIDRSFVMHLRKDSGHLTIIQAVIQMAKSLDIQVVAEGVEEIEQFAILRDLGCDFYQGYYFSRPVPADQVLRLLAENESRRLAEAS